MQKVIVAVDGFSDQHMQAIDTAVRDWATCVRIEQAGSEDELRQSLQDATAIVGWPKPQLVAESPVQLLQLASVGYEDYLQLGLSEKPGFQACNLGRVPSIPVAEQVIAMMFALARGLHQHALDKQDKRWLRLQRYPEITGSTVCIIGVGGIGTEVARRCKALGMEVLGVGRHPEHMPSELLTRAYAWNDMATALSIADHVVLCFPATSENANMFNAGLFGSFKKGAILYNVGRGSVVHEADLVAALHSGQLGGAGLDVFQQEPLPPEHPLWEMENVIITPHSAGRSVKEYDRICQLFVDNLERFHTRQPLLNRISL
ncbi:D-2-hydroxyacid dehydrogenase [Aeoliella sp.]|uniref:D-2-hydroxyacid dehydrogenase n=1 Tax=Aeoliella sp. TaxID=2795800 RepID=UPI003CCBC040